MIAPLNFWIDILIHKAFMEDLLSVISITHLYLKNFSQSLSLVKKIRRVNIFKQQAISTLTSAKIGTLVMVKIALEGLYQQHFPKKARPQYSRHRHFFYKFILTGFDSKRDI